ncbi:MAG: purine-binding chemotaxis protein CheW [Gammaproteobacteria bacterium]|nr:purine-binding chemotaxis protein CheW [Gammaproteobacteria bacterium]
MARTRQDPIALLRKIQQESIQNAPGLPQEVQAATLWSGVAFRIADLRLVTQLDEVLEVLPFPEFTWVPSTKPWIKGVANIRGNLITIVDLPEYFGKPPVHLDDEARLLVMNIPELHAGLLVHEVLGLRHFDQDVERQKLPDMEDPVMAHLNGAFIRDDQLWSVFDMRSLAESVTFKHVAA